MQSCTLLGNSYLLQAGHQSFNEGNPAGRGIARSNGKRTEIVYWFERHDGHIESKVARWWLCSLGYWNQKRYIIFALIAAMNNDADLREAV